MSQPHRLNPEAQTFTLPIKDYPFEIRPSPGKGFGLFATRTLPIGSLVISETALFKIPYININLAWKEYCKLDSAEKAKFDCLRVSQHKINWSALTGHDNPFHHSDASPRPSVEASIASEQIRVLGVFAANSLISRNLQLAVFANLSRLNHSCIPNVQRSTNASSNKESIHAIRDILPGEELSINYLDKRSPYMTRAQRWEILREIYGFTCLCAACTDPTGRSDAAREMLSCLTVGLDKYLSGAPKGHDRAIPGSSEDALLQAEDVITLLLQEGLLSLELTRAYRSASRCALALGDYDKAVEYAYNEAEVERNVLGSDSADLKELGADSESWLVLVATEVQRAGLGLERFDRNIYRKVIRSLPETRAKKMVKKQEKEGARSQK